MTKHRKVQTTPSTFICLSEAKEENRGICRRIGAFFGLGGDTQVHDQEEPKAPEPQMPDISEAPVWKNTVDANALIMMTVAVFMWGYFA